jgi:hypothetical protein
MTDDKPLRESSRAAWCFEQYCRLGPQRSIAKLAADLQRRQNNGENVVKITTSRLEHYSRRFSWPARAAAWDAEQAYQRQQAYAAEVKRQEAANAQLMHQVGQGCLAIGALILNTYGASDGSLAKGADLTEASRIIKTGVDVLRAASGQPTDVVAIADVRQMQQRFEASDHETRAAVVAGLRALKRLQRGDDDEG